ncbi:hypothetical protein GJ744_002533 [Endocarpon pusillum]|uniref:BTB domain-containing protein n=1 Tax=Endocarpon pusillum TaxID=364733 RepID=A0A8H7AFK1_9EURO|nr:hypothetical protein GJ744_002533 [Endocarpon pusillum]
MMPAKHHLGSSSVVPPAPNKENDIAAVDQAAGASSEPPRKRLRFAEDVVPVVVLQRRFIRRLPTSFESFLSWLYSIFTAQTHMIEGLKTSVPYLFWSLALQLYTLAHYLQCPAFGNNVITCIRTRLDDDSPITEPNAQQITDIYSRTSGDCGLRRLIVLMHTLDPSEQALPVLGTEEQIRAWIENVPAKFARDLIVQSMMEKARRVPGFWAIYWVVKWVEDGEMGYSVENNDLAKATAHNQFIELVKMAPSRKRRVQMPIKRDLDDDKDLMDGSVLKDEDQELAIDDSHHETVSPSPKRLKYQNTSAVTVFVGQQATPFVAHKEFLCEVSDYFRAALTGQFAEAKEDKVNLPEQKAHVFDDFLTWLYGGSLDSLPPRKLKIGLGYALDWEHIRDLYVFAKYIQCPKFSNHLLNSVWKSSKPALNIKCPGPEAVKLIYQDTVESCGLRRLVVDYFMQSRGMSEWSKWKDPKESKAWISKFPNEFCCELLVQTSRREMGLEQEIPVFGVSPGDCPYSD